jgi:hypothetical protein
MDSVKFCPHCGGLLERGFLFCPYCGTQPAERPSAAQIIAPAFENLARIAAKTSLSRLDSCRRALDTLEKELDDFLGAALKLP